MNTLIEYNISYDAQKWDYVPSDDEDYVATKAHDKINSGNKITKDWVQKLEYYVDKYPNYARLKNLLAIAYEQTGNHEGFERTLVETVEKHPDYFFGKSMVAEMALKNNEPQKAFEIMGGFTTLKSMFPDHDVFHPSEIKTYHSLAVEYHSYMRNEEQAILHLQILKKSGIPDDFIRVIAKAGDKFSLFAGLARFNEDREKYNDVETYFHYEDEQTEEAPVFNHPIVEELYTNSLHIGIGLLEQILTLDRQTLIEDLEKVVNDGFYRFEYHWNKEGDIDDNFVIHAIQLLAELRSYDSLELVLELLRQDNEFEEVWFGDMLGCFFLRPLHLLGKERLNELEAFLKEANVNAGGKHNVLETLRDIAVIHPERKQEIAQIIERLLDFYWENKDDEDIIDGSVVPWAVSVATDLRLDYLLPKIKPFFDAELADEMIIGNLKGVEDDFVNPNTFEPLPIFTLEEQYKDWNNSKWTYHFTKEIHSQRIIKEVEKINPERVLMSLYEKAFGKEKRLPVAPVVPLVSAKINRNDKVNVRYLNNGKVINDIKYKKVEADVLAGKCVVV
jgi:Protein of unknown function (DUF1186)